MSDHLCPAPGCSIMVPRSKLACRSHWYQIPKATRDSVWDAYRHFGMGSEEHTAAILDAVDWLRASTA